jgi:hypothetical protein
MGTELAKITVGEIDKQKKHLGKIGGKLGLKPDPVYVDAKTMMIDKPDAIRKAGIIQGLQDLGYLPERPENGKISEFTDSEIASALDDWPENGKISEFTDSEIASALDDWRSDTRKLKATYKPVRTDGPSAVRKKKIPSQELNLSDPLPILLMQTSYENELQLYRLPKPGTLPSLLSRILQFRMKTFNRYEETVGKPFSQASMDTFKRLKVEFGFPQNGSDLKFLNHLGNASKLSLRFCNRHVNTVFVYLDPNVGNTKRSAGAYHIKWAKRSKRITQVMEGKKKQVTVWQKSPILRYRKGQSSAQSLADINNTEANTLGLELLQLRLWQHGYYTGAIDADWGRLSRDALDQFIGSCEPFDIEEKDVRGIAKGGYALSLVYLLNHLFPASEKAVAGIKSENLNQITDELFPVNENDPYWKPLKQKAREALATDSQAFVAPKVTTRRQGDISEKSMETYRRRRLNFSWLSIKSAIGGWFQRFWKAATHVIEAISNVAKKVREFLLKGVRSVTTVFRYALTRIKRAVRIATAAVRRLYYWIAGKPFGSRDRKTGSFMASRWSTDFDTVNICSKDCRLEIIDRHLNRIAFMNASFQYMSSVALTVLEIMVNVAIQNWLRVAYLIYKALIRLKDWGTAQDPYLSYHQSGA